MTEPIKILFISQEINPIVVETELANLCRKVSQHMQEQKYEVRVFMPCFGQINERRNQLHEVQRLSGMNIIIDDTDHPLIIKVATIQPSRMQVYFTDSEDFFRRKGIKCDRDGNLFDDNDFRSLFFIRSVLETLNKLRWSPSLIYCSGWLSSLAPLYLKRCYSDNPFLKKAKIVYSISSEPFVSPIRSGFEQRAQIGEVLPEDVACLAGETFDVDVLHRLAIKFSDAVTVDLPTISESTRKAVIDAGVPYLDYAEREPSEYLAFFRQVNPALIK